MIDGYYLSLMCPVTLDQNTSNTLVESVKEESRVRVVRDISEIKDIILDTLLDVAQNDIRNKLFLLESELPPVDVMFYYRAIEWLGETADAAQKVGSRFEVMLTK